MTNLAYSFRSPKHDYRKTAGKKASRHRSQQHSSSTMEYPFTSILPFRDQQVFSSSSISMSGDNSSSWEKSPLIPGGPPKKGNGVYGGDYSSMAHPLKVPAPGDGGADEDQPKTSQRPKPNPLKKNHTANTIAAFYLMDYEAGRPPTLPSNFESITPAQLKLYRMHFSWFWKLFGVNLALLILFLAHTQNHLTTAMMHTYCITFFFVDLHKSRAKNQEHHQHSIDVDWFVLFSVQFHPPIDP